MSCNHLSNCFYLPPSSQDYFGEKLEFFSFPQLFAYQLNFRRPWGIQGLWDIFWSFSSFSLKLRPAYTYRQHFLSSLNKIIGQECLLFWAFTPNISFFNSLVKTTSSLLSLLLVPLFSLAFSISCFVSFGISEEIIVQR